MNLFQILCQGGCALESDRTYYIIRVITNIVRLSIPLLIILFAIIKLVKWVYLGKKNKERIPKKEIVNKTIKSIFIAIILFIILTIISVVISLQLKTYDGSSVDGTWPECWCSK